MTIKLPMNINLTIILPTYNEEENVAFLIPEIIEKFKLSNIDNYEILVVDDNSSDKTQDVVVGFSKQYSDVKLIARKKEPSLPLSIYDGIINSSKENIMWLDSDGSMDVDSIIKLLKKLDSDRETVFIGSRFISGGGYKGKEEFFKIPINKMLYQLIKSEDSLIAIFLSLLFNKALNFLLDINVKDLTSGFITGNKKFFNEGMFKNSVYGEYFIYVVSNLFIENINMQEVGYFCKPRIYGESKTSTNLIRMVSLSKPYFQAALKSRKLINQLK